MVVYVDLAFLINFSIDAALLFATAALFQTPGKLLKISAAAGVGAFYAVLTLFPGFTGLAATPYKLLAAFLMTWLAMGTIRDVKSLPGWRRMALRYLGFLGVAAASGGVLFALQSMFTPSSTVLGQIAYVHQQVVWWTSLDTVAWSVLFPVAVAIAVTSFRRAKRLWNMQPLFMQVFFGVGQKSAVARVLVDSGNVLKDPLSHDPVAIMKIDAAKSLFLPSIYSVLSEQRDPFRALFLIAEADPDNACRFRVIPFHGIGGKSGNMLGVRLDAATALDQGSTRSLLPLVLAFASNDQFPMSDFDCILPAMSAWKEKGGTLTDVRATSTQGQTVHSTHTA